MINNTAIMRSTYPETKYLAAVVIPNELTETKDVPIACMMFGPLEYIIVGTAKKPPPIPKYPANIPTEKPDNEVFFFSKTRFELPLVTSCSYAFFFSIKNPTTAINPAKRIKRFPDGVHNPSWAPNSVPAIPGMANKSPFLILIFPNFL